MPIRKSWLRTFLLIAIIILASVSFQLLRLAEHQLRRQQQIDPLLLFMHPDFNYNGNATTATTNDRQQKQQQKQQQAVGQRPPPGASGVGLVTTDGSWGPKKQKQHPQVSANNNNNNNHNKNNTVLVSHHEQLLIDAKIHNNDNDNTNIKILGFTDQKYLPIAKIWYERLTELGYTEHFLAAHDPKSYHFLRTNHYRTIPCFIQNPEYDKPIKGLWQQIMKARLHVTMALLRGGTHLLISDVDNVFSRFVPLYGFLEEGFDVYHAYEMRYPVPIFDQFGFVVCSGFQFLRSSPETLRFLDLVLQKCNGYKCDDQVTYNNVLFFDLDIQWDNYDSPNHEGALRVSSNIRENDGLLVESATGRSRVTNHTIKIWDRDFAWRLSGDIPEKCPSMNNWVGMPNKLPESLLGKGKKIRAKIGVFDVWDEYCLNKTKRGQK